MDRLIKNSSSEAETKKIAEAFAKKLKKGTIVAFLGDLGAGKTFFIKSLVNSLDTNQKNEVTSPTFTYLNIYESKYPIYHFDLYRIKNKNHFLSFGFDEYLAKAGICLIEWAENILDLLPKNTIFIKINHKSENKREIEIEY